MYVEVKQTQYNFLFSVCLWTAPGERYGAAVRLPRYQVGGPRQAPPLSPGSRRTLGRRLHHPRVTHPADSLFSRDQSG
jgi:hypothetical protein